MKALVLTAAKQFEYKDVPDPEFEDHEILVKVQACGICGSDVHGMDLSTGRRIPPIIMGHEASGIVEQVGKNVKQWKPGDRVTFDSTIYCGDCYFCWRGEVNLCDNRRILGVSCEDYRQHGAFAEYVVVPSHTVCRLPDNVSFEAATLVEGISIAVHAVQLTPISLNDTAVVVGSGMIGLLVIQALKSSSCGWIIAVDLDESKLTLAKELGADIAINAKDEKLSEIILDLTHGRGANVAFEVVGVTAAVDTAVKSLRKGGALTVVGNLSPRIDFPLQAIVTRELTLYGSCASSGEFPLGVELISQGKIKVDPMISTVAPLEDGPIWFEKLYNGEAGLMKVVLKP